VAETPPDHAHLEKKKLHASLCFDEEKTCRNVNAAANPLTSVFGDETPVFKQRRTVCAGPCAGSLNRFTLYSDLFSS